MNLLDRLAAFAFLGLGVLLFASAPATAAAGWSVSGGFSVGPFDFDVYYQAGRYGHHYYRTPEPIHYRGLSCSDACFHRAGYDYHHASCPVVGFHFRRYHFHPGRVLEPLFYPRRGFHRGDRYGRYGYRSYGGYDHRGPSIYRYRGHGPYGDHGYRGYGRYRGKRHDRDWDSDSDSDRRHYRRYYDRDWDSDSDSDSDQWHYRRRHYDHDWDSDSDRRHRRGRDPRRFPHRRY